MMDVPDFPCAPLGVFDSGVGGLTVLRKLQELLPSESVLYLADTANVPYGDKPISVVRDLAIRLTDQLVTAGAKAVIMASGTSTVAGLDAAQARYPQIPIFGTIEVGARAALAATDGPIGVLATNATANSRAFTQAIQRIDPGRTVVEQGCPRFVPLVESGCAESGAALAASGEYLGPLIAADVGAIILGCTHFPFLVSVLQEALTERRHNQLPVFVDPAEEAVRAVSAWLRDHNQSTAPGHTPLYAYAASGDPDDFRHQAGRLLRTELPPIGQFAL